MNSKCARRHPPVTPNTVLYISFCSRDNICRTVFVPLGWVPANDGFLYTTSVLTSIARFVFIPIPLLLFPPSPSFFPLFIHWLLPDINIDIDSTQRFPSLYDDVNHHFFSFSVVFSELPLILRMALLKWFFFFLFAFAFA